MKTAASPIQIATATTEKEPFDLLVMKERSLSVKKALFSKQGPSSSMDSSVPGWDDSSVSSLESNTSGLQSIGSHPTSASVVRRRSLFSKYWIKTGECPSNMRNKIVAASLPTTIVDPPGPPTAIFETADDQPSQEEIRSVRPMANSTTSIMSTFPSFTRRSLFSTPTRRSISMDCLRSKFETGGSSEDPFCSTSFFDDNGSPIRRKSDGELGRISEYNQGTPVSCLRESRFSLSSTNKQGTRKRSSSICSESSSVVQFDMESTEIRHFIKPAVFHAEEGWTDYFY